MGLKNLLYYMKNLRIKPSPMFLGNRAAKNKFEDLAEKAKLGLWTLKIKIKAVVFAIQIPEVVVFVILQKIW